LKANLKKNLENENEKQKEEFKRLKEKYDREGVEFITEEGEMGGENKRKKKKHWKPGQGQVGEQTKENERANPINKLINQFGKGL